MTHRSLHVTSLTLACIVSLCIAPSGNVFAQNAAPSSPSSTPAASLAVHTLRPLIVGGTVAADHAWPWQAMLQWNGSFRCGASLIGDQWVLTAAHCMYDQGAVLPAGQVLIVLGDHNRDTPSDKRQTLSVARVLIHPGYTGECCMHDVALLKLAQSVVMNDVVASVPMLFSPFETANHALPAVGTHGIATGWGRTGTDAPPSAVLQQVELTVTLHFTPEGYFVASSPGLQATCYGDSGGPFVVNIAGQWRLAGIASFSSCQYGGGFSRVADHAAWINDMLHGAPLADTTPPTTTTLTKRTFVPLISR